MSTFVLGVPAVLSAQGAVLDSVRVEHATSAPSGIVVLHAGNVAFTVTAHREPALVAVLRPVRAAATGHTYAGALRVTTRGDTTRVDLARALDVAGRLDVTLPSGVALQLEGENGGPVRVEAVGGPVEITHSNAGVTVFGAAGSAVVATSNGNVEVVLVRVTGGVPMSFITSNGDIDLTLPADVRATFVVDRSIALQSELALFRDASRGADDGAGPLRLAANGGGPTIRLYTNNGVVRLHHLAQTR